MGSHWESGTNALNKIMPTPFSIYAWARGDYGIAKPKVRLFVNNIGQNSNPTSLSFVEPVFFAYSPIEMRLWHNPFELLPNEYIIHGTAEWSVIQGNLPIAINGYYVTGSMDGDDYLVGFERWDAPHQLEKTGEVFGIRIGLQIASQDGN